MQTNQFDSLVEQRNLLVAEVEKARAYPGVETEDGWAAYVAAADRQEEVDRQLMASQPRSIADLAVMAAIVRDYYCLEEPSRGTHERVGQLLTAIETLAGANNV